jgi:hypothetical protein
MRNPNTRRVGASLLAVVALALTGCGGDDDDSATDALTDAGDDDAADDGDGGGGDGGGASLDDIPDECRELMGDFLERIEPIVEDIDWENATLDDFDEIGAEFDEEMSAIEEEFGEIPEECENIDLEAGTEDSLRMITELAEDRAPGVVPFLEWQQGLMDDLGELSEGLSDISIPDISIPDISMPDISMPAIPDLSLPADAPQTCEDAIAYVEDLVAEHDSMMSMPIDELTAFSNAQLVISSECSLDDMTEFFNRSDIQDFLSG